MREAVCLYLRHQGSVLAVARRGNLDVWALPGGKVDPGESLEEALIREVREETGLLVEHPVAIFQAECRGETDFLVTTFEATVVERGDASEDLPVDWVRPGALLTGPFAAYNEALFAVIESRRT